MAIINVSLLGKLLIRTCDEQIIRLQSCKAAELFAYLLLFRKHPHSREAMAEKLWDNNSKENSRAYLRRTLWQLQNNLECDAIQQTCPLLLVESEWLQINPLASLWIDVSVLENVYTSMKGIPGEQLDTKSVKSLQTAVNLYGGHLLEGWYQDWCVLERERLNHIYLILLDKLMHYCEAQEHYETGIEYGMCILRQDPAREQTHRKLMRLQFLAGDRAGALRQYERCVTALQEELGVKPTQRTQLLKQQIHLDFPNTLPTSSIQDENTKPRLRQVLSELKQIKDEMTILTTRLDHEIDLVSSLLLESE